jgi:outer membrane biosynthesis protein TonB
VKVKAVAYCGQWRGAGASTVVGAPTGSRNVTTVSVTLPESAGRPARHRSHATARQPQAPAKVAPPAFPAAARRGATERGGATVLRVETDSDGVYEAHLQTSAGQRVTVEVDKSFKVTGEEAAPQRP